MFTYCQITLLAAQLQSVIMHPDMRQVIHLAPEAIKNVDGQQKQDCEIQPGKRLIWKIRQDR
ncbi:hypothetical protein ASN18_3320 [Candidatus Magnetominusculus xianensis]|uniref:Uncharacterized protein n=1 Tax=Candidatus Magnetominusculus xianensis TaxID=1748249 RepID=A0ABR5SBR4_9BACT|nr:hypothetical protein ASN18_3320 [Candidatus Magnetominusculus xianensis]